MPNKKQEDSLGCLDCQHFRPCPYRPEEKGYCNVEYEKEFRSVRKYCPDWKRGARS